MTARSQAPTTPHRTFEKGQRLYCRKCGSEIEIISPCTCEPPDQVLRCCGEAMTPSIGVSVNLNVEE
jgi:hypothetical protein